ncbi:MAG: hypothetical protein KKB89_02180, partial [Candidatus Omnitrophica bacterium]|nr:hypothetical protein [Candidatus Omnitrophota bacterium]
HHYSLPMGVDPPDTFEGGVLSAVTRVKNKKNLNSSPPSDKFRFLSVSYKDNIFILYLSRLISTFCESVFITQVITHFSLNFK